MVKLTKTTWLGVVILVMLLVVGFVSNVSAAPEERKVVELTKEVRLLQRLADLNLTNEQIDKMLPILKQVDKIYTDSQTDLTNLLNQQKSLILNKKTKEANALEAQKKAIREKTTLNIKAQLVDIETILTAQQKAKLAKNRMVQGQHRVGMINGSNGQSQTITVTIAAEAQEIKALVEKIAKAQGTEKEKLQKQLEAMKKNILIERKDGPVKMQMPNKNIVIMHKGMTNGQMSTSDVRIEKRGMMTRGRGLQHQQNRSLFANPQSLPQLIKALEEMRAAN